MIVEVDDMTYECDLDVQVGDAVRVELSPAAQERWGVPTKDGLVTRIGSDWQGVPVSKVLCKLELLTEYDQMFLIELLRRVAQTTGDSAYALHHTLGLMRWVSQQPIYPNDHQCRIGWQGFKQTLQVADAAQPS